jgi:hypothetical protein
MTFPKARTAGAALERVPEPIRGRIRLGGGSVEASSLARLPTGLADVDRLLGGGFPRGRLSEITGPPSSGRTSLALALAAASTSAGEIAAWVDAADALDPASLEAAGVKPERVLWVRAPGALAALRSAERLLAAGGFALVVLDLGLEASRVGDAGVWMRLARGASASGTALALLGREQKTGSFAALVVDLRATRVHFAASPAWLEGLSSRVALVRHRLGAVEGFAPVCWTVTPLASCDASSRIRGDRVATGSA